MFLSSIYTHTYIYNSRSEKGAVLSFRARGARRYLTNASARYGEHDMFPRALFYALVARCCFAIKSRNLPRVKYFVVNGFA